MPLNDTDTHTHMDTHTQASTVSCRRKQFRELKNRFLTSSSNMRRSGHNRQDVNVQNITSSATHFSVLLLDCQKTPVWMRRGTGEMQPKPGQEADE